MTRDLVKMRIPPNRWGYPKRAPKHLKDFIESRESNHSIGAMEE